YQTSTLVLPSSSASCPHATPTTEIYPLSLHDALPISHGVRIRGVPGQIMAHGTLLDRAHAVLPAVAGDEVAARVAHGAHAELARSEEHTSELQSRENLVCRLLLEKKKTHNNHTSGYRV